MSFYGSIYYELVDTFYKILIHNSGRKDGNSFPESGNIKDEQSLVAIGRQGVLDVDTGNDWIKITADPSKTKYVLWHDKPNTNTTKDFPGFQRISEEQIPEGSAPIQLAAGDTVAASAVTYDMAGHVVSNNVSYYKLPVSTVEEDVKEIQEGLEDVNEALAKQAAIIGDFEGTFESDELYSEENNDITKRLDRIGYIEHIFPNNTHVFGRTFANAIGELTKVYPQTGYLNKSLCDAIGNWEEYSSKSAYEDISSALAGISDVANKASENSTAANNSFNLLKDVVDNLVARVEALEGTSS